MLVMRAIIALQPDADLGPDGRAAFDELVAKTPAADNVSYQVAIVGGVAGWWCRPADASPDIATLYLHGGAYVVGSAQAYRHFTGQIAARARAPVFVADYSLAPERLFPAPVDDADAAYRGLMGGGLPGIAIVGDSAGGGLALVTASRMSRAARDGDVSHPAAVVALSPWTDLAATPWAITCVGIFVCPKTLESRRVGFQATLLIASSGRAFAPRVSDHLKGRSWSRLRRHSPTSPTASCWQWSHPPMRLFCSSMAI